MDRLEAAKILVEEYGVRVAKDERGFFMTVKSPDAFMDKLFADAVTDLGLMGRMHFEFGEEE